MNSIKVVIGGWFGKRNIGDEAILHCMVSDIRETFKKVSINAISSNPNYTKHNQHIEAIKSSNLPSLIKLLLSTDVFILGGGGLIKDGSCIKWFGVLLLFKLFGARTMCYSTGAGHLTKILDRFITRLTLNHFTDVITVRDKYTRNILENLKVKREILVTADPVVNYSPVNNNSVQYINSLIRGVKRPLIGVSLREFKNEDLKEIHKHLTYEQYTNKMASELDEVVRQNRATLIMFPCIATNKESDIGDMLNIYSKMNEKSNAKLIRKELNISESFSLISILDALIGQRLHSLILGAVARIPLIAVVYAPKIRNFMKQINLFGQCVWYNELGKGVLTEKVKDSLRNRSESIHIIEDGIIKLRHKIRLNLLLMSKLVGG